MVFVFCDCAFPAKSPSSNVEVNIVPVFKAGMDGGGADFTYSANVNETLCPELGRAVRT